MSGENDGHVYVEGSAINQCLWCGRAPENHGFSDRPTLAEIRRPMEERIAPLKSRAERVYEQDGGCACHIAPPCTFCVSLTEEEADYFAKGGMVALSGLWAQSEIEVVCTYCHNRSCTCLARFEILGDLYYRAHLRLRPGKDDPLRDSSEPENRAAFDLFLREHALDAALDRIDQLNDKIEKLEKEL